MEQILVVFKWKSAVFIGAHPPLRELPLNDGKAVIETGSGAIEVRMQRHTALVGNARLEELKRRHPNAQLVIVDKMRTKGGEDLFNVKLPPPRPKDKPSDDQNPKPSAKGSGASRDEGNPKPSAGRGKRKPHSSEKQSNALLPPPSADEKKQEETTNSNNSAKGVYQELRNRLKSALEEAHYFRQDWHEELLRAMHLKRPAIALTGAPGAGKTSVAILIAERVFGVKARVIDGHSGLLPSHFTGRHSFEMRDGRGSEVWLKGALEAALEAGEPLIVNEADALEVGTFIALVQSLAQDPLRATYMTRSDGVRVPVRDDIVCSPLILTMNTRGDGAASEFTARFQQDAAVLDRLTLIHATPPPMRWIIENVRIGEARLEIAWAAMLQSELERVAETLKRNGYADALSTRSVARMAQELLFAQLTDMLREYSSPSFFIKRLIASWASNQPDWIREMVR